MGAYMAGTYHQVMTVHDTPVPDESGDEPLELLTDDAECWTAVPLMRRVKTG